jgi:hypothetical protein
MLKRQLDGGSIALPPNPRSRREQRGNLGRKQPSQTTSRPELTTPVADGLFGMNPITTETHVVLWSPHQKQFHHETVGEMLEKNLRIYFEDKLGDYTLLAFCDSSKEAYRIVEKLAEKKAARKKPEDED